MVESSGTFEALEVELTVLAEMHIAAFDSYVEVINDPVKGHFARYTTEQGNKLTVAKYRAADLTLEKIRDHYKNIVENAPKLNKTYLLTKIDQVETYSIYHNLAKVPFPLTNRSTVSCEYIKETDGTFVYVVSSKGCEPFIQKHAKIIGKNVIGRGILIYEKYTPYEGGYDITTVTCVDPAGSIPGFLKDFVAKKHAEAPVTLYNLMMFG